MTLSIDWYGFATTLEKRLDLDFWEAALTKGDKWKFNVIRIPFLFSTLDFTILDQIIEKVDAHGAKAVLDFHALGGWVDGNLIGTQAFIDDWLTVVNRYKDDTRVIAYEIANEPDDIPSIWIPSCVGADKQLPKLTALIEVVDGIRAVDPDKLIVLSPSYYWGNINVPIDLRRSRVILSHHPYSYGNQSDWQGLLDIATYRISFFERYASQFDGQWCGEFECHTSGTVEPYPNDLEKQYVVYILDYCITHGYGFSLWKYGYQWDDGVWDHDVYIGESVYEIPSGGEMNIVKLTNTNDIDYTQVIQKIIVETRTVVVPAGTTIEVTLEADETLIVSS